MTDYIVLRKRDAEKDEWQEWKMAPAASSRRAAIAAVVNQDIDAGSVNGWEYVAVPARSWKPIKVQVETALKFS